MQDAFRSVSLGATSFKAVVAYDGTDFVGYQSQAEGRTVQGVVETALNKVNHHIPVRIVAAGRTDSGVHALGQVISFNLMWKHQISQLKRALNVNLPNDVVVRYLEPCRDDFHPRFDAFSRQYRYVILNQPDRDVFATRYSLHVPQPLDLNSMKSASQFLLGEQDFIAFGKPPQGNNSVRTILQAEWSTKGAELIFEITADAFLYRMVRNIVGVLLRVGQGKLKPSEVSQIIQSKNRALAGPVVRPNGLTLIRVNYRPDAISDQSDLKKQHIDCDI